MIIKILGSGAGGGFPQWNCNGTHSANVRAGKPGYRPRTQSSLAISSDGTNWVLLNASPDLRQQIADTPELHPVKTGPKRNSPIKAAVLTNADVDHIVGLINLRERQPFSIYGSEPRAEHDQQPIRSSKSAPATSFRASRCPSSKTTRLSGDGIDLGLTVKPSPFRARSRFSSRTAAPTTTSAAATATPSASRSRTNATARRSSTFPGCAEVDAPLAERIKGADLIFFDGTLFTDDEMLTQGLLDKTGRRMGHISMSGPEGSVEAFKPLGIKRRVYVHINNSNPALDENSEARKYVEAAGWEVGYDGMEVRL